MQIVRNIRLGVKSLLLHKLRSFLTMLGMVFGVGSVIAMLSVGEGASRDALAKIERLGTNNILIDSVKPSAQTQSSGGGRRNPALVYGLTYLDAQRIQEQFPQVQSVVPVRRLPKQGRLGSRSMELNVVGTSPAWFELVFRPMQAGRPFNWLDYHNHAGVAVLTEHGARRLLATGHSIGQSINIGGRAFTVIGIVETADEAAGSFQMPDRETDVYIPLTTARERFGELVTQGGSGSFSRELVQLHQIIARVDDIDNVRSAAQGIEHMLVSFRKPDEYRMSVPLELLRQAEQTKRIFNIVLGSIAGISLLVGGIGIMNIMLASITERTREIGIRRAIGARKRQIVAQFLTETVVLSAIGGLLGVALGVVVPILITMVSQMPTSTPLYSIILSLGISASVGIIFGLYPAIRAANLDPIVALRHE